jgi:membrane protein
MTKPKNFLYLIKESFREWSEDKATRLAAALAYYTSFSLAPLLVVVIAIAGLFGGQEAVHGYVMNQIGDLLGADGGEFVASMIDSASKFETGAVAAVLGLVTLLFGALGVFGELQNSLNTIWEVKPKPIKGFLNSIWHYIIKRLVSFTMLMVIVFLLLVSLVISAGLSALGEYFGNTFAVPEVILQVLNFVISFGLITVLFALLFKYLPDAEIKWRDVWLGAAVTSLLFTIGKFVIGLYLGKSDVGTTFGAAGSLAILLIWVYYSAQILFFGAEFTQVYANKFGSRIVPSGYAVKVTEEDRKEQGIPHGEAATGSAVRSK